MTSEGNPSVNTCEPDGTRACSSRTIRKGERPYHKRVVSDGLSATPCSSPPIWHLIGPQTMHPYRRNIVRNPNGRFSRFPNPVDITVPTLRPLQSNERTLIDLAGHKSSVQCLTFFFQYPSDNFYTGLPQPGDTLPRHLRERIEAADNDPRYLLLDNQVGTRRSFPVMRTRLQRNIQCTFRQQSCIPHRIYGIHLGMRLTVTPMIPLLL